MFIVVTATTTGMQIPLQGDDRMLSAIQTGKNSPATRISLAPLPLMIHFSDSHDLNLRFLPVISKNRRRTTIKFKYSTMQATGHQITLDHVVSVVVLVFFRKCVGGGWVGFGAGVMMDLSLVGGLEGA